MISSNLERSVLHDLWSMANLTSPGQLTQTELYQLLGLIGLAQNRKVSQSQTTHVHVLTDSHYGTTIVWISFILGIC